MRRGLNLWLGAIFFALFATTKSGSAQTPNVTIAVTGSGPSFDEARADAIRQALQRTMKQLVVVDRVVSGDRVLRDKIMSTMNGYIERYEQKAISKTTNGLAVTAEITVSASRIENFIGVIVGGGGKIDSPALIAEQNRRFAQIQAEQEQAKARGEIFDRVLRGFPAAAMDVKLLNIGLSQGNPNILEVQVEYSFKPTFMRSLEGTLKAISVMQCAPPAKAGPIDDWEVYPFANGARSTQLCAAGNSAGSLGFLRDPGGNGVCLRFDNGLRCYSLAPGVYCASCDLENFGNVRNTHTSGKRVVFFWRFIDSAGLLANRQGNCFASLPKEIYPIVSPQSFVDRPDGDFTHFIAGFDLRRGRAVIEINSALVDLARAKSFVAVVGLAMPNDPNNRWVTSLVPDIDNPSKGGCQLLDQATRLFMLTQAAHTKNNINDKSQSAPPGSNFNQKCFMFNGRRICEQ